jgi:predicted O-linked N-acetylglucosamine transferase (SPINDLY family)
MRRMAFQQTFGLAVEHHRAGRLQQAHELYRQLLAQEPGNVDVLHLMGVLAHQTGRNDIAIDLIGRAIAGSQGPNSANVAAMHYNFGEALRAMGRREEAVTSFRRAIELEPRNLAAHSNLALVLNELGRYEQAKNSAQRAIEIDPSSPLPHNNLATALAQLDQNEAAIAAAQHAIQLRPDFPDAHNTLGICYGRLGRLDDAVASHRRAVQIRPDYVEAMSNLGAALAKLGRRDEALAALRQAVRLRPDSVAALDNLALELVNAGQLGEAAGCYQRLAALRPDSADAQFDAGTCFEQLGQLDEAVAALTRALAIEPEHIAATGTLGIVRMKQGLHDDALRLMRQSLSQMKVAKLHTNLCLLANYHPDLSGEQVLEIHREWERDYAPPPTSSGSYSNDHTPDRKLRIGYVSPDFKAHASGHFIEPLLAHHDRSNAYVVCYANVAKPDAITSAMRGRADAWRDTYGRSDDELEAMVRADQIDILVDLAGHTADTRLALFARRPAPVQVSMIGYPSTTGLGSIDYKISDPHVDPPGAERFYSEKLLRLDGTFWCFAPVADAPPVDELPAKRNGFITFGSANNVSKITPAALDAWARILAAVPESRLRMQHSGFSSVEVRQRIFDAFARHGIAPDRVSLSGWARFKDYLELLRSFDLALDTFPFNGGTTTCQQLYLGVPCVTLAGQRQVSRMGVTMLRAVGLEELIAESIEQYVQKAVDLARDIDRLCGIRANLRPAMLASLLCDGRRYITSLEGAYRKIWASWCG